VASWEKIKAAKLIYLVVTSRFLEQPVSAVVKGPSSGGKSYLTQRVLGFFPSEAYYALSAMSEKALIYSQEPLEHRFLVVFEAAGLQAGFMTYIVRSLLSEGRVRYQTVEKKNGSLRSRLIEREGPTGLLVTTTAVLLHPENETRMLSILVNDTPEQTQDILRALAQERPETTKAAALTAWQALQVWLEKAEHRVTIPYAKALAEMVYPGATRLRRDFGAVLNLIRAHALLHQARRERDAEGRIVAMLEDYAIVHGMVGDLVADGVGAAVPPTIRQTVEAVRTISEEGHQEVSVTQVADLLNIDKSAAWRRVRAAIQRGYLENREEHKGRPARLVIGDPLPDDVEILPSPEALEGCGVANGCNGSCNPYNVENIEDYPSGCTVAGKTEGYTHPRWDEASEETEDTEVAVWTR
jgi:hypothetical protein